MYDQADEYFKEIDNIETNIEAMESSVDYLTTLVERIENKID